MSLIGNLFGLGKLQTTLDQLVREVKHLSNQEAELDTALQELAGKIDALVAAVNALIAAIPPGVDLSEEIAAVQTAAGEVQTVTDTAGSATPPGP